MAVAVRSRGVPASRQAVSRHTNPAGPVARPDSSLRRASACMSGAILIANVHVWKSLWSGCGVAVAGLGGLGLFRLTATVIDRAIGFLAVRPRARCAARNSSSTPTERVCPHWASCKFASARHESGRLLGPPHRHGSGRQWVGRVVRSLTRVDVACKLRVRFQAGGRGRQLLGPSLAPCAGCSRRSDVAAAPAAAAAGASSSELGTSTTSPAN